MASIHREKSGTWRVQVRRKGRSLSETFIRYKDAQKWGVDAERQIDRGETPILSRVGSRVTATRWAADVQTSSPGRCRAGRQWGASASSADQVEAWAAASGDAEGQAKAR